METRAINDALSFCDFITMWTSRDPPGLRVLGLTAPSSMLDKARCALAQPRWSAVCHMAHELLLLLLRAIEAAFPSSLDVVSIFASPEYSIHYQAVAWELLDIAANRPGCDIDPNNAPLPDYFVSRLKLTEQIQPSGRGADERSSQGTEFKLPSSSLTNQGSGLIPSAARQASMQVSCSKLCAVPLT